LTFCGDRTYSLSGSRSYLSNTSYASGEYTVISLETDLDADITDSIDIGTSNVGEDFTSAILPCEITNFSFSGSIPDLDYYPI
jgi:hypothetical protein